MGLLTTIAMSCSVSLRIVGKARPLGLGRKLALRRVFHFTPKRLCLTAESLCGLHQQRHCNMPAFLRQDVVGAASSGGVHRLQPDTVADERLEPGRPREADARAAAEK